MSPKLEQAKQAIRQGDKQTARRLLAGIIKSNPEDDQAWVWLAVAMEDPEAQEECLERALKINPANQQALRGLARLRKKTEAGPEPQPLTPAPITTVPSSSAVVPPQRVEPTVAVVTPAKAAVVPETEPNHDRVAGSRLWLYIAGIGLVLVVLCGGGLLTWLLYSSQIPFIRGNPATAISTTELPISTATDAGLAIAPATPTPTAPAATVQVIRVTATPSITPVPSDTPTRPPTSTFTPRPTGTPTPTAEPQNAPGGPDQFSSADAVAQRSIPEITVKGVVGPGGSVEVAPSLGTSGGYQYYGGNNGTIICSMPDPGNIGLPRLTVANDGLLQLSNFQAQENVTLYTYETGDKTATLTGTQLFQTDTAGQLSLQILDHDPGFVYVVIGDWSGEVINATGRAFCGSIMPRPNSVITRGWVDAIIVSDNQFNENPQSIPPGTQLNVLWSRWNTVSELWWYVEAQDGTEFYVRDSQVQLSDSRAAMEPTPPGNGQSGQEPGVGMAQSQTAEQFIRQYYQLYAQGYTNQTWGMLTENYKQNKRAEFSSKGLGDWDTEYQRFPDTISGVDLFNLRQVNSSGTTVQFVTDLYFYGNNGQALSPYNNFTIIVVWDDTNRRWLLENTY